MSKEQYEQINAKLKEVTQAIEAISESSVNGLLIDAVKHTQNASEHLRRYFQKQGGDGK